MSDQLHDLLTRIADQAGPGPTDPDLWSRARRARRDRRRLRAAAVGALVLAVLAVLTVAGSAGHRVADPPPVDQPDRRDGPGIPATIYAVPRDGGLRLETDLGVGVAAAAMSNATGVFLVTAEDGAYHRVRLPGFDPGLHSAAIAGLALSPDGRRLAWTWHGPRRPGPSGPGRPWGLRVADLVTGQVRTARVDTSESPGLLPNPRWSPDGRYVVADQVFGIDLGAPWAPPDADAGYAVEYVGAVVEARRWQLTSVAGSYLDGSPYDAWVVAPSRHVYRVVGDRLLTWEPPAGQQEWRRSTVATGVSGVSTGRISDDGRWLLMSGRAGSTDVALVDLEAPGRPVAVTRFETGATTDVLGWTDDRHVLALQGPVDAERTLVRLALEPGPADVTGAATSPLRLVPDELGRVLGSDARTSVSIATDLAAGERTTWDADPPAFAPQPVASDGRPGSPGPARRAAGSEGGGPRPWLLGGGAVLLATLALATGVASRRQRRS